VHRLLSFHAFAQPFQAASDPGLNRAERAPELRRKISVRQPVEEREGNRALLLIVEAAQAFGEPAGVGRAEQQLLRARMFVGDCGE
jgi:hypothetical protein